MNSLATVGRAVAMAVASIRYLVTDIARLRLPAGETIQQSWSLLSVTAFPAALMAIPFGAMVSVQVGGLLHQLGATSLTGAASALGIVRQGAPAAASLLMGGAAAAAIASDLGTRTIREEIDAMRAMGVDPVQRLVVPRLLAMLLIAPVILATLIFVGVTACFVIAVSVSNISAGSFWASFGSFATPVDLVFALLKVLIGAVFMAIISCLRGLEAKGGPRGVADAVNAAVVLSVVATVFITLVVTQLQTMFYPEQLV
ncbi:MlaE family ABC transporter permease [Mycolicibacter minnesotensis]